MSVVDRTLQWLHCPISSAVTKPESLAFAHALDTRRQGSDRMCAPQQGSDSIIVVSCGLAVRQVVQHDSLSVVQLAVDLLLLFTASPQQIEANGHYWSACRDHRHDHSASATLLISCAVYPSCACGYARNVPHRQRRAMTLSLTLECLSQQLQHGETIADS